MVWTAFFQVGLPIVIFTSLEEKAFFDSDSDDRSSRVHFTREVVAWEKIMIANASVWGPMFLFGAISLSEFIQPITAFYIEHGLSNLQIPAYLAGTYYLFGVASFSELWEDWLVLASFCITSFTTYKIQINWGTDAMNFLKLSEYQDPRLLPSLFYILRWIEHEPRMDIYY